MSPLLAANDLRFLDVAHELSDADWTRPSLCTEWTNHQVLAHLVLGHTAPVVEFALRMGRTRGGFDAANTELARELAARHSPAELILELHRLGDRWAGVGRLLPRRLLLGDHVIHELDIVFALDRPATVPGDVLAAVLDTQATIPNPFVPARRRARGLNLRATDVDWARPGPAELEVTGSAADLASVLAGRPHALPRLSGPGATTLAGRLP